jgi:tetratricopeptide (TPR) repeat protein
MIHFTLGIFYFLIAVNIVTQSVAAITITQSKSDLSLASNYRGMHYAGHWNYEYYIENKLTINDDAIKLTGVWYDRDSIYSFKKAVRKFNISMTIEGDKVLHLDESYRIYNGSMYHNWATQINDGKIFTQYFLNDNITPQENSQIELGPLPAVTFSSLVPYLQKIKLHRNLEKNINIITSDESGTILRPFKIKVVDEQDISVEGLGIKNCYFIYVFSLDASNDEEQRIYIDKNSKEIVSIDYIVHESESTNNTYPKSSGYERLVTSKNAINMAEQENFDFNDYIEAAFIEVNNNNNKEALKLIDKAFVLDANRKTIKNKLRIMVLANKANKDIDSFIKKVIDDDSFSVWGQAHTAKGFVIGMPAPKSYQTAKAILDYGLLKRPDNIMLIVTLARLYSEQGDFKQAIKHINTAMAKNTDESLKSELSVMLEKLENGTNINTMPGFSGVL